MRQEAVIRIKREDGFTVLPNGLLRDTRLSLKTKGLFCIMLSFPGDWTYSIGGLVSICGAGRDAVRGALRELEAAGYLERERAHDESGRFTGIAYTLYTVSKAPQAENPSVDEVPAAPQTDFPATEKPTSENPTLQNKDYINTPYSPPEGTASRRAPDWDLFDRFWELYPRKRGKENARRAWKRLNPDDALFQAMTAALKRERNSWAWRKQGGEFIPYPATWLNGRRWEDEPPEPERGSSPGGPLRGEGVAYL